MEQIVASLPERWTAEKVSTFMKKYEEREKLRTKLVSTDKTSEDVSGIILQIFLFYFCRSK